MKEGWDQSGKLEQKRAKPLLLGIDLLGRVLAVGSGLVLAGPLLASCSIVGGALHDGNTTISGLVKNAARRGDRSYNLPSILLELTALLALGLAKAVLLILCPTFAPVTLVTTAGTATAASTETTTATAGLDATGFDVPNLLLTVIFLALDEQILSLPLGLRIQSKEFLLLLLSRELNKNASLEDPIVCAAETNCVDGSVRSEEGLNVNLGGRSFLSEALGVDATAHGLVFENLGHAGVGVLGHRFRERHLAAHAGVVISQLESFGGLQSLNNGAEGLEATHALERMKEFEGHGAVAASAHLGKKELVHGKVRVREVEFDLLADLIVVVCDLQRGGIKLDIVATVSTAPCIALLGLALLLLLSFRRLFAELRSGGYNASFL
jgi:hypothetical protein